MIIADEPTGNLNSATAREVMATLSSLKTHDREVAGLTDRRIHLRDGSITEDAEVEHQPAVAEGK